MADLNLFRYDFNRQSWHLPETCVNLDSWELSRWPSRTLLDFSAVQTGPGLAGPCIHPLPAVY